MFEIPKRKGVPIPETLSDCIGLYEKGYTIEVNDGQIITVSKGEKHCFKKYLKTLRGTHEARIYSKISKTKA